jgi:hypothetical protein
MSSNVGVARVSSSYVRLGQVISVYFGLVRVSSV